MVLDITVNNQIVGKEVEQAADNVLRQYELDGHASIAPTYPKVIEVGKSEIPGLFKARRADTGLPDRIGTIFWAEYGIEGVMIVYDVKSVKQANTVLLSRSHQFWQMIDHARCGAMTGYLVRWYGADFQEWCWHWAATLPETEWKIRKRQPVEMVRLNRQEGLILPDWVSSMIPDIVSSPDFLETICHYFQGERDRLRRLAGLKRK